MIQQRRHVKSKLQKTASFIVVSNLMFHQNTHIYIQPAAFILLKESRG